MYLCVVKLRPVNFLPPTAHQPYATKPYPSYGKAATGVPREAQRSQEGLYTMGPVLDRGPVLCGVHGRVAYR